MKSQTIQNKHYSIEIYSGAVTDFSQRSETHVSGSGSEGSVEINSQVTNHLRFFLVDENGVEKDFQVTDWDIPIRVGHKLTISKLSNKRDVGGVVVGVKNLNTEQIYINNKVINHFSETKYGVFRILSGFLFILILVYMVGTFEGTWIEPFAPYLFGWGCLISFVYGFIQDIRLSSKIEKSLYSILSNI